MGFSLLVFDVLRINNIILTAMLSLAVSGARLFLFSDSFKMVPNAQK